jgi:hypothetical protein
MQWLTLILLFLGALPALCFPAGKGSTSTTVKPDPVIPGDYRVYDSKGNLKETWKADPVIPGHYRIEDRKGNPAGFIKPDPVSPGSYRETRSPNK